MPCHYYTREEEYAILASRSEETKKVLIQSVNDLTRLLCEACDLLNRDGYFTDADDQSEELAEWWKAHQKLDAQREH